MPAVAKKPTLVYSDVKGTTGAAHAADDLATCAADEDVTARPQGFCQYDGGQKMLRGPPFDRCHPV